MNYTIVIEPQVVDLLEKVNELIEQGWQVSGGVAVTHDAHFCQAMTKPEQVLQE